MWFVNGKNGGKIYSDLDNQNYMVENVSKNTCVKFNWRRSIEPRFNSLYLSVLSYRKHYLDRMWWFYFFNKTLNSPFYYIIKFVAFYNFLLFKILFTHVGMHSHKNTAKKHDESVNLPRSIESTHSSTTWTDRADARPMTAVWMASVPRWLCITSRLANQQPRTLLYSIHTR